MFQVTETLLPIENLWASFPSKGPPASATDARHLAKRPPIPQQWRHIWCWPPKSRNQKKLCEKYRLLNLGLLPFKSGFNYIYIYIQSAMLKKKLKKNVLLEKPASSDRGLAFWDAICFSFRHHFDWKNSSSCAGHWEKHSRSGRSLRCVRRKECCWRDWIVRLRQYEKPWKTMSKTCDQGAFQIVPMTFWKEQASSQCAPLTVSSKQLSIPKIAYQRNTTGLPWAIRMVQFYIIYSSGLNL